MKNNYAFTLIELSAVLFIIAVLISLAIPSYHYLIQKNQVTTITQKWLNALQFAKNTALTTHKTVTVCASSNGKTCSGHWQNGMLLLINGDTLLRSYAAFPKNIVLSWNRKQDLIQFSANGLLKSQNGSLIICPKAKPSLAKSVILSKTGRARVQSIINNQCAS